MGYAATTGFILYWNPDHYLLIHRDHHVWFDEYNSHFSIEDKNNTDYLPLQQDAESPISNSDLLNLIPWEFNITSTPFCDTTIITYEIELPPSGNKVVTNILHYEDFIIPYIIDTTPNSPSGH